MPDREKAIENLERMLSNYDMLDDIVINKNNEMLIFHRAVAKSALAMLKEQEAVEPKVEKAILDYQSWHYICGDCGGQIDIHDNYCRHCGRAVAHLSNRI